MWLYYLLLAYISGAILTYFYIKKDPQRFLNLMINSLVVIQTTAVRMKYSTFNAGLKKFRNEFDVKKHGDLWKNEEEFESQLDEWKNIYRNSLLNKDWAKTDDSNSPVQKQFFTFVVLWWVFVFVFILSNFFIFLDLFQKPKHLDK